MRTSFVPLLSLALFLFSHFASAAGREWRVEHEWTPALESKFSEFVNIMGESGCKSLDACLKSTKGNPFYAARTPKDKKFSADCGFFPYALRMYFAWMEGLPFDYVSKPVQANPAEETNPDIRYTKFGNKPGARFSITRGQVLDGPGEIDRMRRGISTATYRMHYREISDFFPVEIKPRSVRPGTAVYDPSGHAAIVYKIEKDGRVKMMDAHPDNSVTRITFDQKFARSRPTHGAGFRNWRPELNLSATEKLPGFSIEQYGTSFELGGEKVTYWDFVRARLGGGTLKFSPVSELKTKMLELCSNIHDREAAVQAALRAKINEKAHPEKLPYNIYGTGGEWEEFSSPSRDARLKVAFVEIRTEMERFIGLFKQRSPRIDYKPVPSKYSPRCASGSPECFLAASMMSAYEEAVMDRSCIFRYQRSDGSEKKLSYTDVNQRLFKLSFDPYHCSEQRWGAEDRDELSTCRQSNDKEAWYRAEQNLRNQTERTYDERMDYNVRDTEARLGVPTAPDVDLWSYLARQLK